MAFARTWTPPTKLRDREPPQLVRPVERAGVYSGSTNLALAQPKGIAARPGKRAPTAQERRWMDFIVAYGCIACRMDGLGAVPPCVHHILRGGRRMGHLHSLPLCPGHHQHGTGAPGLTARHPYKAQFERRYGTELELLEILQKAFEAQTACASAAIKTGVCK